MKTIQNTQLSNAAIYLNRHIENNQNPIKLARTINYNHTMKRIKTCMRIMIIGLFVSGITAFPLETELHLLANLSGAAPDYMYKWINTVYQAVKYCNDAYPFLSYGTDWLAFAHIMLAVLFIGPLRDPIKNIWVIEFGMIACAAIIPLAFIMGPIRHIPFFWTLVDCSFGIFGIMPLYISYISIKKLERFNQRGL
nr:hypothetical protein [uncultured Mucilaginibacter sp.]